MAHPQRLFGAKTVVSLCCHFCEATLSGRGMRAMLLADKRTECFSTDASPTDTCALVGSEYRTENGECRISNVACLSW